MVNFGRGPLRVVILGVVSFILILSFLPTRLDWRRLAQLDTTAPLNGRPEIEKLALDDSWKHSLTKKTFNEKFIARVDACRAGGRCAENNEKIVSPACLWLCFPFKCRFRSY